MPVNLRLFAHTAMLIGLFCQPLFAHDDAEHIEVLTENWPPFNYEVDGRIQGLGTEVVEATLEQAGVGYHIRLGVWKGVYDKVRETPNILIYTISRTPAREALFEWIGPIAPREQNFLKLKKRTDIQLKSIDDAKQYRLAVQEEDAITQDLLAWGFDPEAGNLLLFNKRVLTYRMLFAGRVDLVTGQEIAVKYQLELDGLPYDEVEVAYPIAVSGGYYMAFKQGSDPELVRRVRAGFDEVKRSGQLQRIVQSYK